MKAAMQLVSDAPSNEPLPARLPKGFVLGGHVVDGWLRDGGMAAIYRARRISDDQRVALKLQLPSTAHDEAVCTRFDREVDVMRRAGGSTHVVELFDAGVLDDGRRYLVMEWVEGEDLEELLDFLRNQDQRLPLVRACRIGCDVARGLATLHDHAVVHLDLKPANVMIERGNDGNDVVKLVDFGIAADLRESDAHGGAAVMGTSSYMSPQQARGDAPEPSFDIYALGVLLYESLSGTCVPPDGWTPETLPRVETRRRGIPALLGELLRSCMAFESARRPASATAVAQVLERVIAELESAEARATRSSEEIPVRSGGTELIPRGSVSSIAAAPEARTGGTEVMLTHEEVMQSSGFAPPIASEVLVEAKRHIEARAAERGKRSRTKWLVLAGVIVLGGIAAWLGRGGESPAATSEATAAAVPARLDRPTAKGVAEDEPVAHEIPADETAAPRAGFGDAEVPLPSEPKPSEPKVEPNKPEIESEPDLAAPAPPAADAAAQQKKRAPKPPSGPSKEACDTMRNEADAAKRTRAWATVLQATTERRCWAASEQRLARTRLRVTAHAEQGAYDKCVKEGGTSTDRDVAARVGFCRKKLEGK